jgi:hypothetical protein
MRIAIAILFFALAGCAAPKDSHKHFHKPKYNVREHARPGTPAVTQRWWSRMWFWQSRYTPYTRSIR